jgi:hypothetical protein
MLKAIFIPLKMSFLLHAYYCSISLEIYYIFNSVAVFKHPSQREISRFNGLTGA